MMSLLLYLLRAKDVNYLQQVLGLKWLVLASSTSFHVNV